LGGLRSLHSPALMHEACAAASGETIDATTGSRSEIPATRRRVRSTSRREYWALCAGSVTGSLSKCALPKRSSAIHTTDSSAGISNSFSNSAAISATLVGQFFDHQLVLPRPGHQRSGGFHRYVTANRRRVSRLPPTYFTAADSLTRLLFTTLTALCLTAIAGPTDRGPAAIGRAATFAHLRADARCLCRRKWRDDRRDHRQEERDPCNPSQGS